MSNAKWIALALVGALNMGCKQKPAITPPPISADEAGAAAQTLDHFKKTVNGDNYKALGFSSEAEAQSATLGAVLEVQMVGLEALKAYKAGDDPKPLLKELGQKLYLVQAGGGVRASVTVEKTSGGWRAVSFGAPQMARRIESEKPEAGAFLVVIPSLHLSFVARRSGEQLNLSSLYDLPDYGLRAAQPRPAAEVFAALAPIAQRYNGLPM